MLMGGIIGAIAGLILLVVGIIRNNSLVAMLERGSEHPGLVLMIGIVVLVAAACLIIYHQIKNKKQ